MPTSRCRIVRHSRNVRLSTLFLRRRAWLVLCGRWQHQSPRFCRFTQATRDSATGRKPRQRRQNPNPVDQEVEERPDSSRDMSTLFRIDSTKARLSPDSSNTFGPERWFPVDPLTFVPRIRGLFGIRGTLLQEGWGRPCSGEGHNRADCCHWSIPNRRGSTAGPYRNLPDR